MDVKQVSIFVRIHRSIVIKCVYEYDLFTFHKTCVLAHARAHADIRLFARDEFMVEMKKKKVLNE